MRTFTSFAILSLFSAPAAVGQSLSFAVGAGAGPASGRSIYANGVEYAPAVGATALLDAGFHIIDYGRMSIALDVPAAIHGSKSSSAQALIGIAEIYTERVTAVISPGLRIQFDTERRVTPWMSFGAGPALLRRTGATIDTFGQERFAAQTDSNLALALVPSVGADVHFRGRWFLRGELRNYLFKTPANGFVASFAYWNRWNYNPVIGASIGFRP